MDRWRGKIAVVTGASAGIGAAICKSLVEEGLQVVGLARREERVKELSDSLRGKSGKLYPLKCDVSDQDQVVNCFKWIKENVGTIQILINNAGIVRLGTLIDGNPDDWRKVLDTNVMGLCVCTREAVQQLKESGLDGHIVHINSTAGHYVFSGVDPFTFNIYSPSKHAVTCMTEIARRELIAKKLNIKVTSVSPGAVKTEIGEAAGIKLDESKYANIPVLSAEDVASSVVYVLSTPPNVLIQELTIRPMGESIIA